MKHQPRKPISVLTALLATGLVLASCAGKPEYIACPEVSAPREGTQAFMRMDDTREVFDVRMNGVTGLCEAASGGGTAMTVSVGLKLKRAGRDDRRA